MGYKASHEERDQAEEEFFKTAPWCNLLSSNLGVKELRRKLSAELYKRTVSGLPTVLKNIEALLNQATMGLKGLGTPRPTNEEKQQYIQNIAEGFCSTIKNALIGEYTDAFFHDPDVNRLAAKRLRSGNASIVGKG